MGWEDEVENDYEELPHTKALMFDDYIKHCDIYKKHVGVAELLKQGFNKLEINWLAAHRNSDIKRVNEKYYIKRIQDLKNEVSYYKSLAPDTEAERAAIEPFKPPKLEFVNLRGEVLVKSAYSSVKNRYLQNYYVKKLAVRNLWSTLKFLTVDDFKTIDYRSIVRGLIIRYNLNIDADSFNGGRNRARYMFPYYYWPLKVLEHYGYVKHLRNGTVVVKKPGAELSEDLNSEL